MATGRRASIASPNPQTVFHWQRTAHALSPREALLEFIRVMALSKKQAAKLQAKYAADAFGSKVFSIQPEIEIVVNKGGHIADAAEDDAAAAAASGSSEKPTRQFPLKPWAIQVLHFADELKGLNAHDDAGLYKAGEVVYALTMGPMTAMHGRLASSDAPIQDKDEGEDSPVIDAGWNPAVFAAQMGIVASVSRLLSEGVQSGASAADTLALRVRGMLLLSQMASYTANKDTLLQQGALEAAFYGLTGHASCPGGEQLATQVHTLYQLLTLSCADAVLPPTVGDGVFGYVKSAADTHSSGSGLRANTLHREYLKHQSIDVIVNGFKEFTDAQSRLYSALTLANLMCSADAEVAAAVSAAKGDMVVKFLPRTGVLDTLEGVPGPLQSCETMLSVLNLLNSEQAEVRAFARHVLARLATGLGSHSQAEAQRITAHWRSVVARDAVWMGWSAHFVGDTHPVLLAISASVQGPPLSATEDHVLDVSAEGIPEWSKLLQE